MELRLGVVGVTGWAARVIECVRTVGPTLSPAVRLTAAATGPNDVTEMLNRHDVDAVWLPVPLHWHAPLTLQALAAGKAVLCEKAAAGCVQDANAMIAARDRHRLPVTIAYQHVSDPLTLKLKRRLAAGAIGRIHSASVVACAPRPVAYYQRNAWAGRCLVDGRWVMDSPANNALAHFLQLALILLHPADDRCAEARSVAAELYRANPCENFDTIGLRAELDGGVSLLTLLTHACRRAQGPRLTIRGDAGELVWDSGAGVQLVTPTGVEIFTPAADPLREMLERFARLALNQQDAERLFVTLEMARAPLRLVNAASEATPVRLVASGDIIEYGETDRHLAIRDIEACFARETLPHETGMYEWTKPAGFIKLHNYDFFHGPAAAS